MQAFDRDEPNREKIAYVTVKATDKGTPPLETICTFNVTIRDINDNVPMFDKVPPLFTFSLSHSPRLAMRVD